MTFNHRNSRKFDPISLVSILEKQPRKQFPIISLNDWSNLAKLVNRHTDQAIEVTIFRGN